MKGSRIATKVELDEFARKAKARTQTFSKENPERFAREAQRRVDAFCKRSKV